MILENAMRAIAFVAALAAAGMASAAMAQSQRSMAVPQQAQAQSQAPASAAAVSGRMEILTYDNWTVTCRDGRDPKEKRVCTAELQISQDSGGQRRPVFAWIMGLNKDGVPATALRFPPGIQIGPGVELKFADKVSRKIPITTCEPAVCEASTTMDDAFVRDASAVVQGEAIIQASDGRLVTFTINMKGFAQAAAAVRR
jgi:invasion protein IalB